MEGLGYPSGHAICHGGTTLAPISSTQVSSEAESAPEVRFESSSSNNNNIDRRSFHGEQSFSWIFRIQNVGFTAEAEVCI